ncbi:MAG: hypothetical protein ACLFUJ_15745 [Phycisphaerae bacterium]
MADPTAEQPDDGDGQIDPVRRLDEYLRQQGDGPEQGPGAEDIPELSEGSLTTFQAGPPEVIDIHEADEPAGSSGPVEYEPPPDEAAEDGSVEQASACLEDMSLLSMGSFDQATLSVDEEPPTANHGDASMESQNTPPADANDEPTLIERLLAEKQGKVKSGNTRAPSFQPGVKKKAAPGEERGKLSEPETLGPVTEADKQVLQQALQSQASEDGEADDQPQGEVVEDQQVDPPAAEGPQQEPAQATQPAGLIIQPPTGTVLREATEVDAPQPEAQAEVAAEAPGEETPEAQPQPEAQAEPEALCQQPEPAAEAEPPCEQEPVSPEEPADEQEPAVGQEAANQAEAADAQAEPEQDELPDTRTVEGPLGCCLPDVDSSGQIRPEQAKPEPEQAPVQQTPPQPEPTQVAGQAEPAQASQGGQEQQPVQWTSVSQPEPDLRPWYKKHARLLAFAALLVLTVGVLPRFVDLPDFGSADEGTGQSSPLQRMQEARDVAMKMSQLNQQKQQEMAHQMEAIERGEQYQPNTQLDAEAERLARRAMEIASGQNPQAAGQARRALDEKQAHQDRMAAEQELAQPPSDPQALPAQQPQAPVVPDVLKQVRLTSISVDGDSTDWSIELNGQSLQVGQTSREGIRLYRIRLDNVIVRYDGRFYRLRVAD